MELPASLLVLKDDPCGLDAHVYPVLAFLLSDPVIEGMYAALFIWSGAMMKAISVSWS